MTCTRGGRLTPGQPEHATEGYVLIHLHPAQATQEVIPYEGHSMSRNAVQIIPLGMMLALLGSGCNSATQTINPSQTFATAVTPAPTAVTVSPPDAFAPAIVPDDWATHTDPVLQIEFRYPGDWKPESPSRYRGADGYVEWTTRIYPASIFDTFEALCILEANENKPAAFGAFPFVSSWQGYDSRRQFWFGHGCTVIPGGEDKAIQGKQAVLFARLPPPGNPDSLLVLRADADHFNSILSTLHFLDYVTPTPASGIYTSPACDTPPANPEPRISRIARMIVSEYPIVAVGCDPWQNFDGFQARLQTLRIDFWETYDHDLIRRANETNHLLEPFGYRLESRQAPLGGGNPVLSSKMRTVFDLYQEDQRLLEDINRIGPLSVKASGEDFILWVENTDNSIVTEIRRRSLRTPDWWEPGFNTGWVGSDLIRYTYDSAHLFPIGAPSKAVITRNDETIYTLSIPQSGPAGHPVQWLWAWQGHWILEAGEVVVQDGELLNAVLGYEAIFDWHLVNNEPFFLFKQDNYFGISYAGNTLPHRYEDVIHGSLCCDMSVYNTFPAVNGEWFYALRNGTWYFVSVLSD